MVNHFNNKVKVSEQHIQYDVWLQSPQRLLITLISTPISQPYFMKHSMVLDLLGFLQHEARFVCLMDSAL